MATIRVVLADDHPSLRAGLRARLEKEADVSVVGEAGNGEDAVRLCDSLNPDVLVLDMQLPKLSGMDVAHKLRDTGSSVRILALSAFDDEEYIATLLDSGAAGYLTKQETLDAIAAAVKGVAAGEEGWLSRDIAAKLVRKHRAIAAAEDPLEQLTEREREVLVLMAQGRANSEIGERLFIAESTVKKHVNNIYFKLDLKTRAEAVAWAWKAGIVSRDST